MQRYIADACWWGGHPPPNKKPRLRLGIRSFISNATWYISTAIGGKINRPRSTETLPSLLYRGTLRTRVGEGRRPPETQIPFVSWYLEVHFKRDFVHFKHDLVHSNRDWRRVAGAKRNSFRPITQRYIAGACWWGGVTSPTTNFICALVSVGTFQTRRGTFQTRQAVHFPTFHTEAHCGRVLVVGGCQHPRKITFALSYPWGIAEICVQKRTSPTPAYRDTLQTRVGGGVTPHT